jgi:hypothetical protein
MALSDAKIMLAGLAEIVLPSKTLRLCDGGFIYWDGDKYQSSDDEFGTIESVDAVEERSGDEAPAGSLTFLPASTSAAATLSQPTFQGSPMRFWMAEVNEATGEVVGTPELLFDGELDTTTLRLSRGSRLLEMGFISVAERLFRVNEGNVLSTRFHQSIWAGELGFDNATGISTTVAWGVAGPPRGSTAPSGGGGGFSGDFGGGGGISPYNGFQTYAL